MGDKQCDKVITHIVKSEHTCTLEQLIKHLGAQPDDEKFEPQHPVLEHPKSPPFPPPLSTPYFFLPETELFCGGLDNATHPDNELE